MLTFAIPQSEPEAARKRSASRRSVVKMDDARPCGNGVLERDRLVRLGVGEHVEEGRERLLLHDRGLRGHPDESRARVPRVRELVGQHPLAAGNDLAAVHARLGECEPPVARTTRR